VPDVRHTHFYFRVFLQDYSKRASVLANNKMNKTRWSGPFRNKEEKAKAVKKSDIW
jgi:hypothetical protein